MENEIRAKAGFFCPLFKKDMSEVCHKCGWWTGLHWTDEKGETQSKWNCAIVMSTLSNVDIVKATRGAQAATTDMRNEVVRRSVSPPAWAVQQIVRDEIAREQAELALDFVPHRQIGN